MKWFRKPVGIVMICAILFVFACVTINIYFPAEKVESVAGEIVKDIRGPKEGEKKRPSKNDSSSLLMGSLLAMSSSYAWAEEVTTVSNPTIRALKQRMRNRYRQMRPYLQKGMLREGNDGYLSVGNVGGLGLREKRDLKSYVAAENGDRKRLYMEVAKALKIDPSQLNRIAQIFAKEWQKSIK